MVLASIVPLTCAVDPVVSEVPAKFANTGINIVRLAVLLI
jgi:hypothetical protein